MTDRPKAKNPDGSLRDFTDDEMAQWQIDQGTSSSLTPPDNPTLGDWRTGLLLWGRLDQVDSAISTLKDDADPAKSMFGKIAEQRFQFSNNVLIAQLNAFKVELGFTDADVTESMWRANQVARGDLSGVWPLPS